MAAIASVMPVRMVVAAKARTTSVRSLASPAAMGGKALRFSPLRYLPGMCHLAILERMCLASSAADPSSMT
eukprot:3249737-Pyramimonas_sp.AAC.1